MHKLIKHTFSTTLGLVLLSLCVSSFAADRLLKIENNLMNKSDIEHIKVEQVESQLSEANENLILFDIREPKEYLVSHLEGAIQVNPKINAEDFITQYSAELINKNIVFYCSTGRRSTALAEQVKQALSKQQSKLTIPSNMQGGIFRWHNNEQTLVNHEGKTEFVHPYNWYWKRLLEHKDKTQYELD